MSCGGREDRSYLDLLRRRAPTTQLEMWQLAHAFAEYTRFARMLTGAEECGVKADDRFVRSIINKMWADKEAQE